MDHGPMRAIFALSLFWVFSAVAEPVTFAWDHDGEPPGVTYELRANESTVVGISALQHTLDLADPSVIDARVRAVAPDGATSGWATYAQGPAPTQPGPVDDVSVTKSAHSGGGDVAVARVGTLTTWTSTATTNQTQAVTIHADADIVIVIISGQASGSDVFLSDLNFTGGNDGNDFTLAEFSQYNPTYRQLEAWYMDSSSADWPGTGAKTLHYDATAHAEGYHFAFLQYSGVDTSDPIGDTTREDGSTTDTPNTVSVSSAPTDSMTLLAVYNYQGTTTATANSQTQIFKSTLFNAAGLTVAEKAEETAMQYSEDSGTGSSPLVFVLLPGSAATTETATLSLDAMLQSQGVSAPLSLDAFLQTQGLAATASLDSYLAESATPVTVSADSLLQSQGLTTSASIDSLLRGSRIITAAIDAYLSGADAESVTLDALLQAGALDNTLIDALLQAGVTAGVDLDAYLSAQISNSANLDALLRASVIDTISVDAILVAQGQALVTVGLDALLSAIVSEQLSVDAMLQSAGVAGGEIGMDAILALGAVSATTGLDSLLLAQLSNSAFLDAILTGGASPSVAVSIDAWLADRNTLVQAFDAILMARRSAVITADGLLQRGMTSGVGIDAIIGTLATIGMRPLRVAKIRPNNRIAKIRPNRRFSKVR